MNNAIVYVGLDSADDMTTVGRVSFKEMQRTRILKEIDMANFDKEQIVFMKDSTFVFYRDTKGGFHVEFVHEDPKNNSAPTVLHNACFYISQEEILEMRATFFYNSIFTKKHF